MNNREKVQYNVSIVLKIFIGALIPISIYRQSFFLVFASCFVLFLAFLPSIISRSLRIKLPIEIDFIFTVALYLHYFLGEYNGFYVKISWWDVLLHGGNSLILGLVGFTAAFSLLLTSRITGKPLFISIFSFSFAVMLGALWEIFEFCTDYFFGFNMQKSGLVDTMTDLIMDALGALIISAAGFFYIKYRKPGILHKIIVKFVKNLEKEVR